MAKTTVGQLVYEITGDVSGLGASISKAEASLGGLTKAFGGTQSSVLKTVASIAGIGSAIGGMTALISGAISKTSAFESTIGNIETLIGDDAAGVDKLRNGILELTKTVPRDANELGAGAYQILSAGITDSAEALKVLEASGKLAVAGLGTTEEAVNIVTSAINAFELDASQASSVANTLFATVKAGKTTAAELSQSFGNLAAAAHGAGVSFEEAQAATAALANAGFRTSTAQERLRALFDELTRTSGTLSDAIKKVGIEDAGATIKSDGFKAVLDKLFKATGDNTIAFKNLFTNIEAGSAAMALVSGASDNYVKILSDMRSGTSELEKAFGRQADTTANKLAIAQNQFNALLIQLGTTILPVVNAALDKTIGLLSKAGAAYDTFISIAGGQNITQLKKNTDVTNQYADAFDRLRNEIVGWSKQADAARKSGDTHTASLADQAKKAAELTARINELRREGGHEDEQIKLIKDRRGLLTAEVQKYIKSVQDEIATSDKSTAVHKQVAKSVATIGPEFDKAKEAAEKARKELESFQDKLLNIIESSENVRASLGEELGGAFKKFSENLSSGVQEANQQLASIVLGAEKDITDASTKLFDEEKKLADLRKESIEKQADAERELAKLKAKLALELNDQRKADLQDQITDQTQQTVKLKEQFKDQIDAQEKQRDIVKQQIADQQKILDARAGFEERQTEVIANIRKKLQDANIDPVKAGLDDVLKVRDLQKEIEDQQRLASLDEFSRFEETENKKLEKLADSLITEVRLTNEKIDKQKDFEQELTDFIVSTHKVRQDEIDKWAAHTIEQYGKVAASVRELLSIQGRTDQTQQTAQPQFAMGGFVGGRGGQVHPGEYVIPSYLVQRFGGLVRQLEDLRVGGSSVNKTINAPMNINATVSQGIDLRALALELGFELNRL